MGHYHVIQGDTQGRLAEETKTKAEHRQPFQDRYDTSTPSKRFVEESMHGMVDINTQQVSRPIVGDRLRIAKLAAECAIHDRNGDMFQIILL